ncbi:MAG: hypothetical protein V2I43_25465 [Parvularcula sp.]|jgi:hypothetical protein|nr:hypothetical protein [Parvularcula sp.]
MKLILSALGATAFLATPAMAATVTFPLNPNDPGGPSVTVDESAFADRVVSVDQTQEPAAPGLDDPDAVLGAPDYDAGGSGPDDTGAFSLGEGGSITIEFTDNFLTVSGDDANDLFIGEIGSVVETINIEISANGTDFISVGSLVDQNREIDIDAFLTAGDPTIFRFVRITDLIGQPSNQGSNPGADIDFVAALSSTEIPLPAGFVLFGTAAGLFAARRKLSA